MNTKTTAQITIADPSAPASFRQKAALYAIAKKGGWTLSMRETTALDTLTKGQASALIASQDEAVVIAALGGQPKAAPKSKAKAKPQATVNMTEAPKPKATRKSQPKAEPTIEARVTKLEADVAGIAKNLAALCKALGV